MSVLPEMREKELVQRLVEGDEYAFTQLYNSYKRKLAINLLQLLKSDELVEEVLQDLFLKIWTGRSSIDPDKSFQSFLFKVARNLVYDLFRRSARDQRLEAHLMSASSELYSHIEEDIYQKEHSKILRETIDKLPPQRKLVYTLLKIEGKSYKEIGEELGISKPTINEHITKANKFLKQELKPSAGLFAAMIALSFLNAIK
jgi:RNA polymerase sigma-70 factor (family 1)